MWPTGPGPFLGVVWSFSLVCFDFFLGLVWFAGKRESFAIVFVVEIGATAARVPTRGEENVWWTKRIAISVVPVGSTDAWKSAWTKPVKCQLSLQIKQDKNQTVSVLLSCWGHTRFKGEKRILKLNYSNIQSSGFSQFTDFTKHICIRIHYRLNQRSQF